MTKVPLSGELSHPEQEDRSQPDES
jgi:hypothetical protein